MRYFVAIPVPAKPSFTRATKALPGLRAVPPGTWHVTMRFLGNVNEAMVKDRMHTLAKYPAMPCVIRDVDGFPDKKKARVAYAHIDADGLDRLAQATRELLEPICGPATMNFIPHVTLGRFGKPTDITEVAEQGVLAEGTLDRIVLYRSTLTPKGPAYDEKLSVPLA